MDNVITGGQGSLPDHPQFFNVRRTRLTLRIDLAEGMHPSLGTPGGRLPILFIYQRRARYCACGCSYGSSLGGLQTLRC